MPGRYVFVLTVTDAQGLSANDTVSIIVHPDPLIMHLVEITFGIGVTALTQAEVLSLEQKLELLLGNNMKLIARDLRVEPKTGEAILVFYVERTTAGIKTNDILMGIDVERLLADKLWAGSNIVGTPISDIRTTVCQNKCSGHGVCNSETRSCMCETFWMPSVYYFWGFSDANCGECNECMKQKTVKPFQIIRNSSRLVHSVCGDRHVYSLYFDIDRLLGTHLLLSTHNKTTDANQNHKIRIAGITGQRSASL